MNTKKIQELLWDVNMTVLLLFHLETYSYILPFQAVLKYSTDIATYLFYSVGVAI